MPRSRNKNVCYWDYEHAVIEEIAAKEGMNPRSEVMRHVLKIAARSYPELPACRALTEFFALCEKQKTS